MGRTESAKKVVGIFIYFVLLYSAFYLIYAFADDYNLNTDNFTTSGGGIATNFSYGYCSDVRFDGNEPSFKKAELTPFLLTDYGYIYDETTCEYYEGFEWQTKSDFINLLTLGFFGSTYETCWETLNYTYYDGGSTNYSTTIGDIYLKNSLGQKVSISELNLIKNDQTLCERMGFDWLTEEQVVELEASSSNVGNIWSIIKNSLTFEFDMNSGNSLIDLLLGFFLVWIPLIYMLLHIFVMLPFVGGD